MTTISLRYLGKPYEELCKDEHRGMAKEVLNFLNSNFKNFPKEQ
jgi:hypothetical protein